MYCSSACCFCNGVAPVLVWLWFLLISYIQEFHVLLVLWFSGPVVLWSCGPVVPGLRSRCPVGRIIRSTYVCQLGTPTSFKLCCLPHRAAFRQLTQWERSSHHHTSARGGSFAPSTLWLLQSRVCLPQIAACGHGAPQRTDLPVSICFQLCPLKGRVACLAEQHFGHIAQEDASSHHHPLASGGDLHLPTSSLLTVVHACLHHICKWEGAPLPPAFLLPTADARRK